MRQHPAALAFAALLFTTVSLPAFAQNALEELDPDLAQRPKKAKVVAPAVEDDPPVPLEDEAPPPKLPVVKVEPKAKTEVKPVEAPKTDTVKTAAQKDAVKDAAKDSAKDTAKETPPPQGPVPGPKPVLKTAVTDQKLAETWERWRKATAAMDAKAADQAQAELRAQKVEVGATDLEAFAVGFYRASEARRTAQDPVGSVQLAQLSVEMSPHLPYAHLQLARAYFDADPTEVGRVLSEVKTAFGLFFTEPRFLRPAIADFAAAVLYALLATAVAVVLMLFVRRSRYFFHDFHHLFPKAAAPWQSAALAGLLLLLPMVFRMGPGPLLLGLFFAVTLYLSLAERIVAGVLLLLVSVIPLLGGLVVDRTAFAGTLAEDVYRLEHGGVDAAAAAEHVRAHLKEGRGSYAELYALGRYELRRGRVDSAIDLFKDAAAQRPGNARLLTNLGNAMLLKGDEEGALQQYTSAVQADSSLAAASFNLSRVYYRRAKTLADEYVGAELDRAQTANNEAQRLDPSLLQRQDPPEDNLQANLLLLSPELPLDEVSELANGANFGETVSRQLALQLTGMPRPTSALLVGGGMALLVFLIGFGRRGFNASSACDKCGRAVCRRCDPELGIGSTLCNQCVHVFARKSAVPPPVKVRKQHEVARYQTRLDRLSYVFGSLCSGAGHIFSGTPVRGALYAFLFLFLGFNFVFRSGVLRAPFGSAPELLRLVPLLIAFLLVYGLTLRGLYKRQTE